MSSAKYLISLLFMSVFYSITISAQSLVSVCNENLTVNSRTAISGNTRNTRTVTLPSNTIGYIIRITITKVEATSSTSDLFDVLKSVGGAKIKIGVTLAEYAVKSTDGQSIDAFVFNNVKDKDNFQLKNDNNWIACMSMKGTTNVCLSTSDCIGTRLYFGFRNNNGSQGLNVKLEVIAIVDNNATTKYSYSISNKCSKQMTFYVSYDNNTWDDQTIASGYTNLYSYDMPKIYIRVYTGKTYVSYYIYAATKYKIVWDDTKKKYDLRTL